MIDEIQLCPFERSIVGAQGHILLRRNHDHAEVAAKAIRRRSHPEWSRLGDAIRIEARSDGTAKQGPARRARAGAEGIAQNQSRYP